MSLTRLEKLKYESVHPQDDDGASKLRLHGWAGVEDRDEHIGVAEHVPNLLAQYGDQAHWEGATLQIHKVYLQA